MTDETDREERDIATVIYTKAALDYGLIEEVISDTLDVQPYVVIGHFAYSIGYDGETYMAPIKKDMWLDSGRRHVTAFYPEWDKAANVSAYRDNKEWPGNRLIGLIGDIENIADIMRQMGIVTETAR